MIIATIRAMFCIQFLFFCNLAFSVEGESVGFTHQFEHFYPEKLNIGVKSFSAVKPYFYQGETFQSGTSHKNCFENSTELFKQLRSFLPPEKVGFRLLIKCFPIDDSSHFMTVWLALEAHSNETVEAADLIVAEKFPFEIFGLKMVLTQNVRFIVEKGMDYFGRSGAKLTHRSSAVFQTIREIRNLEKSMDRFYKDFGVETLWANVCGTLFGEGMRSILEVSVGDTATAYPVASISLTALWGKDFENASLSTKVAKWQVK